MNKNTTAKCVLSIMFHSFYNILYIISSPINKIIWIIDIHLTNKTIFLPLCLCKWICLLAIVDRIKDKKTVKINNDVNIENAFVVNNDENIIIMLGAFINGAKIFINNIKKFVMETIAIVRAHIAVLL